MQPPQAASLHVRAIGAHPDDCENTFGGAAVKYSAMGHRVKFLSVANGDGGHQSEGGGALARRRRAEAQEAARHLGITEYEVLDHHDGEVLPAIGIRAEIIRRIRVWNADIVLTHRPNDYHPDHRYTSMLVQDAAYLVVVPNVCPDTPPLRKNPVFLYFEDRFQRPNPFRPDIVVAIDDVYERKLDGLDAHVSQMYEWLPWVAGTLKDVPTTPEERRRWLAGQQASEIAPHVRAALVRWYGVDKAHAIRRAEAFEICEYGRQPEEGEIRRLFPMLPRASRENCAKP